MACAHASHEVFELTIGGRLAAPTHLLALIHESRELRINSPQGLPEIGAIGRLRAIKLLLSQRPAAEVSCARDSLQSLFGDRDWVIAAASVLVLSPNRFPYVVPGLGQSKGLLGHADESSAYQVADAVLEFALRDHRAVEIVSAIESFGEREAPSVLGSRAPDCGEDPRIHIGRVTGHPHMFGQRQSERRPP